MTNWRNDLVANEAPHAAGLEAVRGLFTALVGPSPRASELERLAAAFEASRVVILFRPGKGAPKVLAAWPDPYAPRALVPIAEWSAAPRAPTVEEIGTQLRLRWPHAPAGEGVVLVERTDDYGRFRVEHHALLLRLARYAEQAVALQQQVEAGYEAARAHASALSALPMAMAVVDRAGNLVFSNAAGRTIIEEGEVFAIDGRRLALRAPEQAEALLRALEAAATSTQRRRRAAVVRVAASDGGVLSIHVQPLQSAAIHRVPNERPDPLVLLRIDRLDISWASRLEAIGRRYALTPAELRVMAAAIEHRRAAAIARALETAVVTVRSHLRNIYDKTGSRGVPALIALVHAAELRYRVGAS